MLKLSISNIAWITEKDIEVYDNMIKYGYSGLEIAPTRIFTEAPYDKNIEAKVWSERLKGDYGFVIPSMQSIWYGRQEKLFETEKERKILLDYTKKAVDFAEAIGCNNLVFGCPRNRCVPEEFDSEVAIQFFKEVGNYAAEHNTIIGMEANPPIYNTNYINDTLAALDLVSRVNSDGFRLNLDVGTMIQNGEVVSELVGKVRLISHVHISEPGLKPIEERKIHIELKELLEKENYQGFVSIEMGRIDEIKILYDKMRYVRSVFE